MALLSLLGVFLCALGTVVDTSGMLCMKRASLRESSVPFYLRRYFWLGLLLLMLNASLINLVVYAVAPLSLVAPVSSLTVVWGNVFACRGWITGQKEDVSGRAIWANGVIISGIVLTTTFGPKDGDLPSPEEMAEQLRTTGATAYALAALAAISISAARLLCARVRPSPVADDGASAFTASSSVSDGDRPSPRSSTVAGGIESGEGGGVGVGVAPPSLAGGVGGRGGGGGGGGAAGAGAANFLLPLSSALCASLAVVSFKAVAIYVARRVSSASSPDPGALLALGAAVALSALNVVLFNAGMERSRASYLVSTYQALVVILVIVAGGLFYDEFAQLGHAGRAAGFGIGVAIAVVGIGWLSCLQPSGAAGEGDRQMKEDCEEVEWATLAGELETKSTETEIL